MIFYKEERAAMFIDGANLYAACERIRVSISTISVFLEGFLPIAGTRPSGSRLLLYRLSHRKTKEYSPIRPLVDWLDYNGYTMVTKPTKEFTDAFGRRKIKGNMDIELAIDVMEMSEHIDHIIIFSGDGDFRQSRRSRSTQGRSRQRVVSTMRSSPPMVADELRRQADNFIELQDLMPHIACVRTR